MHCRVLKEKIRYFGTKNTFPKNPMRVNKYERLEVNEMVSTASIDRFKQLGSAVKVIQEGDYGLIFLKDNLSIRLVSLDQENQKLDLVQPAKFIAKKLYQDENVVEHNNDSGDTRPSLERLTLTVSNVCNLGCSYCYASGGSYYNANGLMMTKETAFNAINKAVRSYSHIGHINFFGGEPTLNREIIEIVCEYVFFLYKRGVLKYLPSFGITTNGFALSDKMLTVLNHYNFSVTLSLDGPREIHDLNRLTKSGKGSYNNIVKNIKKLLSNGIDIEFECTYTIDHLKKGLNIVNLMDFFHNEFGCKILHCPIASLEPHNPNYIPFSTCSTLQGDAIEYSIMNLVQETPKALSIAVRMLNSLINKSPIWDYCPAGRSEITVNADGNIYSCFMLMKKPAYSFGSVNSCQIDNDQKTPLKINNGEYGSEKLQIENLISSSDKYSNNICSKCWAQPLCHGCLGEDFDRMGNNIMRSEEPKVSEFCDYKRGIIERFLIAIAKANTMTNNMSVN